MRTTDIETELAQTAAEVEHRLTERDMAIIRAFALNTSLRRIAEATHLSHVGVKKLVERRQHDFVISDDEGNNLTVMEAKAHAALGDVDLDDLKRRWTVIYTVNYDAEGAAADSK